MNQLTDKNVSPSELLLDPNNYRFHDFDRYIEADEERFNESTVQDSAYNKLKEQESLRSLKQSIKTNGFIPVDKLVVRPYHHNEDDRDLYVVIEGNRRLAAVKWLLEDHRAGATVPELVLQSIESLPVLVAEESMQDEVFRASLMGIRHVGGISEWGGYQRAKLIGEMRDELGLDPQEIGERLGLTTHEVTRRYRAISCLRQMREDEDYGTFVTSGMYKLFHEAVSIPVLRKWLEWVEDWDNDRLGFMNEERKRQFYALLTPTIEEGEDDRPPKITTYLQVRKLREIISNEEARRLLFDSNRDFEDARSIIIEEERSKAWIEAVRDAVRALDTIGVRELKDMTEDDLDLLSNLNEQTEERLNDHSALCGE